MPLIKIEKSNNIRTINHIQVQKINSLSRTEDIFLSSMFQFQISLFPSHKLSNPFMFYTAGPSAYIFHIFPLIFKHPSDIGFDFIKLVLPFSFSSKGVVANPSKLPVAETTV